MVPKVVYELSLAAVLPGSFHVLLEPGMATVVKLFPGDGPAICPDEFIRVKKTNDNNNRFFFINSLKHHPQKA